MSANIILAISGLTLLLLSAAVYVSNPKKQVNRAFTAFLLSGFLWLLANFLANRASSTAASLFFTRAALIGGALLPLTFLIFVASYTKYRALTRAYIYKISVLPLIIIIFTPTSWNIAKVGINGRDAVAGQVYWLLVLVLISYFSYGIYKLAKYYRIASTVEKSQLQYIFVGLILTIIPALITNGLLPLLGSSESSAYGPSVVVIVSIFVAVAIVKHQLLDIRLIVARSLTYLLMVVTLGVIFGAFLLTLTSLFFDGQSVSLGLKASYLLTALGLAFIFQPLKQRFNKLSNAIFYRDAYETPVFISQLNKAIVSNIDLAEVLKKAAQVVVDNINVDFCVFILDEQDGQTRTFGTRDLKNSESITASGLDALITKRAPLVLDYDEHISAADKSLLISSDIAAVCRVHLPRKQNVRFFMLWGIKKSGNPYTNQDINMITITTNEMSVALQNSLQFEEIQRFNLTLQEKVEEATKELKKANVRLKELDHTKDEFISMASHQLRTPLTTIKGYLSMLLEGDVGSVNKDEKKMIQQAFDSAERMVFLIADLLNVSRLQSGKFVVDNKPTDLIKMVDTQVTQLQETAKNHHLSLSYEKPDKFPMLKLDDTKIQQVVMNFMDNAIYYTPAGGSIEVATQATDSEITYTVTDTGLGVPQAEQHHLFSKFYRAGNARKMRPDGTGLGLFMAKKVILAQGGALIFKSTEGKGSTFGFSFPRAQVELKS